MQINIKVQLFILNLSGSPKEILDSHNKQVLQIMAALISGSLRSKDHLEQKIEANYHLNILSNVDHILTANQKKSSNAKSSQAHQNQSQYPSSTNSANPNSHTSNYNSNYNNNSTHQSDSNLASLRNKKLLNHFLESYLTKSSFGLLNDPNFALVNLIRNYLFFYAGDFNADLAAANKPDEMHLKVSINEIFNSWSSIIIGALEKKSSILNLNAMNLNKQQQRQQADSSEDATDQENNQNQARAATAADSGPKSVLVSILDDKKVVSATEKALFLDESAVNRSSENKGGTLKAGGGLMGEDLAARGKVGSFRSTTVNAKVQIKNANRMFKPFLNFIGIDAPTGK